MKIAWFSCGVTSAVACKIASELYSDVEIVYQHIDTAHPDNNRFIADCEKWIGLPVKSIKSKKYADQFEVIEDTGYFNGADGARCTMELKKQVRKDYQKERRIKAQIWGFEWKLKEINRAIRFIEQNPDAKGIFPLIDRKLNKSDCKAIIQSAGIKLPFMYELGYDNNNCIGCVKGGMGYWNKIRIDFPESFKRMAELEREKGYTCLKDKNGKLFLDELDPSRGNYNTEEHLDCGSMCDIRFVDIISPHTAKIMAGETTLEQLKLFP